ncbi:nickel uptake substrate-specific transmembrane region [Geobacter sp. OR-1]|uniref:carboxypeptidase regulatory-like domain-containing protein n=1 Tax=Geobacter sp. OR-1 TaxID=1266765 RepID=UPI0005426DD3|nr:carboxypeptidase regulatory-like domain-containing protein [Geobacter sp. OR-1]GAM11309.1 nickel uptake substrate-specific transmembrane region [Geobacter sp. OR-1]
MGKFFFLFVAIQFCMSGAAWGATGQLQGTIVDESGKPVAGAELFLYDSVKTKRPADYISAKTGPDGRFVMKVPSAVYWGVARVRHSDKYGPLLAGDLHSGEPLEIDLSEKAQDISFTVADIQELSRAKEKSQKSLSRLEGRVTDQNGQPLALASVYVWNEPLSERLPDLISAWTEQNGEYSLHLPPGKYLVMAATAFPPPVSEGHLERLTISADQKNVALNLQVIKMEADSTVEAVKINADGISLDDE